jgi:23S rRNA pseudouridine2604 synthase
MRVRVGPLLLGDLPEGKWRHLLPAERNALIAAGGGHGET